MIKIKFFLIFTLITFAFNTFCETADMGQRWYKLVSMIDKEIKTIKSVRNPGPNLLHRTIELKTQKMELIHEKENKEFLKEAIEKGNKNNKQREDFFQESKELFNKAKSIGKKIEEEFPRYNRIDLVYYTLGINERDYAKNKELESFLIKSLKTSNDREIQHNSMVELAEYYYNEKRYDEAINLYQHIKKNKSDKWLPKHLFNLAWCHYQTNNRNKSIDLLMKSYELGVTDEYISISEQVLNSIALFHIMTNREKEGVRFFKSLDQTITLKQLLYMTNLSQNQGSYEQTKYILNNLIERSKKNKNDAFLIDGYNLSLDIYRNAKDYSKFENSIHHILELFQNESFAKENDDKRMEAIEKIKGLAGYFQEKIHRQTAHHSQKFSNLNSPLLQRTLNYFDLLIKLSPEEKEDYLFYKAETLVATSHFAPALTHYRQALNLAVEKKRSDEFVTQVMDSLLATLEEPKVQKNEKQNKWRHTRYAYRMHLNIWPKNERSQKIYPIFFNLELNLKNYSNSERILKRFVKALPEQKQIQQELAIIIMDEYVQEELIRPLNQWIQTISKGFLSFDQDYIDESIEVLANLLFRHLRENEEKRSHDSLLHGYKRVFNNEIYPKEIRSEAAYHISRLYTTEAKTKDAKDWISIFLKIIPTHELNNYEAGINTILIEIGMQGKMEESIKISTQHLKRNCQQMGPDIKNDLLSILLDFSMATNKTLNFVTTIESLDHCAISRSLKTSKIEKIIKHNTYYNNYRNLHYLFSNYWSNTNLREELVNGLIHQYWAFEKKRSLGERVNNSRITKALKKIKNAQNIGLKNKAEIKNIFKYQRYLENNVDKYKSQVSKNKILNKLPNDFKSKNFHNQLDQIIDEVFISLEDIQNNAQEIIDTGHPQMILTPYFNLSKAYNEAAKAFKIYSPKNIPHSIEEDFYSQIHEISTFLEQESKSFTEIAMSLLNDKELLVLNSLSLTTNLGESFNQINFNSSLYLNTFDKTDKMSSSQKRSIAEAAK